MHGSGELVKSRNGMDDDLSNLFGKVCPLKNLCQFIIQIIFVTCGQTTVCVSGCDDRSSYIIFSIFFNHFSSDLTQIKGVLD